MFKIRIIKDLRTGSGWVRAGEEMEARILPGGLPFEVGRPYQVIEGKYSGYEIPQAYAVTIPEEKLYTEQQYEQLKKQLDIAQESAVSVIEERQLLQEEINAILADKKVAIPLGIAEAIEHCERSGMSKYGIIANLNIIQYLFRDYPQEVLDSLKTIKQFADAKGWTNVDTLMLALVNGYTIEESPQERIKRGVQEIYVKWTTIQSSGDDQADGADLAERISNFVDNELKQ
ncbi:hypothetical protein [Brevibacillus porteri]|uniref:hypothetical protein n=1 Tax=Brevibacillus porteri TaxID=2126350 RepID=UPI003D20C611